MARPSCERRSFRARSTCTGSTPAPAGSRTLKNTAPVAGTKAQFEAVRDADAANGIVWLDPAPLNDTYAIALATENATELGFTTLSDVATYATANPAAATICAASEFLARDDGLPGLEAAYGMKFATPATLELGLIPPAIDKGTDCLFGEVFATDSRVVELGLTVLEDDKSFFPAYEPSRTSARKSLTQTRVLPNCSHRSLRRSIPRR